MKATISLVIRNDSEDGMLLKSTVNFFLFKHQLFEK